MARMQSGVEFPQFDQMTTKEERETVAQLKSDYELMLSNNVSKEEFEEYKKEATDTAQRNRIELHYRITEITAYVQNMYDDYTHWCKLWTMFFNSKFFRFLNFFGRWFIYANDGKIYPNTPEWKDMRPVTWIQRICHKIYTIRTNEIKKDEPEQQDPPDVSETAESEVKVSDSTDL